FGLADRQRACRPAALGDLGRLGQQRLQSVVVAVAVAPAPPGPVTVGTVRTTAVPVGPVAVGPAGIVFGRRPRVLAGATPDRVRARRVVGPAGRVVLAGHSHHPRPARFGPAHLPDRCRLLRPASDTSGSRTFAQPCPTLVESGTDRTSPV